MKLGKFELDKIYCGDSKELMEDVPSNKVDLIVTDPPYGYSFMGKDWDKAIMPVPYWKECFRVLKPGAFIFFMSSPRQDVLMRAIGNLEKAGFNMGFTSIYWTYASGFPKASNMGLMIDKQECRKQLTKNLGRKPTKKEFKIAWEKFAPIKEIRKDGTSPTGFEPKRGWHEHSMKQVYEVKERVSPQAQELEGSYAGFQPKPAVEVIIVAMKPLSEKTYVDQALKNRKGITWLDDGRIPYESEGTVVSNPKLRVERGYKTKTGDRIFCQGELGKKNTMVNNVKTGGRFPANLLVSDDVLNDGKITKSEGGLTTRETAFFNDATFKMKGYGDIGSYSRYFDLDKWAVSKGVKDTFPFLIVPKASKSEKNKGLEGFKEKEWGRDSLTAGIDRRNTSNKNPTKLTKYKPKNIHPTVKPIKLMSYLITLGSREGDIILDNFCGSGTTLVSAKMLNRRFLGFDTEMEYVVISRARLSAVKQIQEKLL